VSTRTWINHKQGSYLLGADWVGGKAPGVGDTAVISSAGDGAAVALNQLLGPNTLDSVAALAAQVLHYGTVTVQEKGYILESFTPTPAPAKVPLGYSIANETIDLLGAGSAVGLTLQKSTLARTATVNVSGLAYFGASYNNVLAGTINVGRPITLDGKTVATPPADAHGVATELDINVLGNGSWTTAASGDQLTSYVPTTTNTGTINVADGGQLWLQIAGNPASIAKSTGLEVLEFPQRAEFDNAGVITIGPGSLMIVASSDGDNRDANAMFANNGKLALQGSTASATGAVISAAVSGTGTMDVTGGSAASASNTFVEFNDSVTGMNFSVKDGTVVFNSGGDTGTGLTDAKFTGGGFGFAGGATLVIDPASLTKTMVGVFGIPLSGFASGDTLQFGVNPVSASVVGVTPVWNQATHVLSIIETSDGPTTTGFDAANFTIAGSYSASSFKAAMSWNGSVSSPIVVTVTTTGPAAAATATAQLDQAANLALGPMGFVNGAAEPIGEGAAGTALEAAVSPGAIAGHWLGGGAGLVPDIAGSVAASDVLDAASQCAGLASDDSLAARSATLWLPGHSA
jgi:hypothetical protein